MRWVDATTGETIKAFDAVTEGEGIGVKGDTKTINTTLTPPATTGCCPATTASRRTTR